MKLTLKRIKARCDVIGSHWLWTGATSGGVPNLWAPDYTAHDGENATQRGPRAVWHIVHKKPIPAGWRVFLTCDERLCLNPAHIECLPYKEWGAKVAASGRWKGNLKKIAANRRNGRTRTKLTPEKIAAMRTEPDKTGRAVARELGVSRSAVSRFRTGKALCFEPVGGLFTGLLVANDSQRARA